MEKNDDFKEKLKIELQTFLCYALFLAFFFCSLITYQKLLLKEYEIDYFGYGYAIFQALILSKLILLGQSLNLGSGYDDKPLIVPTLYKALVFTLFVLVFTFAEHFVHAFFHHIDFKQAYDKLTSATIYANLAKTQINFFVFVLFFAFLEIENALGKGKLLDLFFRKR